jgi:Holliday junction resolvase RusA-like endonuclease
VNEQPSPFTFTILGPPRTKKNSGQVLCPFKSRNLNRHVVLPSEAWKEWNEFAQKQLYKVRSRLPRAYDNPVNVAAIFYRHAHVGDAAGFYQALSDTLQEANILTDDKFIAQWDGSRLMVDSNNPRVDVTITLLPGEQLSLI